MWYSTVHIKSRFTYLTKYHADERKPSFSHCEGTKVRAPGILCKIEHLIWILIEVRGLEQEDQLSVLMKWENIWWERQRIICCTDHPSWLIRRFVWQQGCAYLAFPLPLLNSQTLKLLYLVNPSVHPELIDNTIFDTGKAFFICLIE